MVKQGSEAVGGTAALVSSGADFEAIQSKIKAKYGVMVSISKVIRVVAEIGKGKHPYGDTGEVITLDR